MGFKPPTSEQRGGGISNESDRSTRNHHRIGLGPGEGEAKGQDRVSVSWQLLLWLGSFKKKPMGDGSEDVDMLLNRMVTMVYSRILKGLC